MEKLFSLLLLISIFSLNGCATAPTHKNLRSASLPELIPLRDIVANTKSSYGYKVSPDGKKIAWLAVKGTKLAIHFRYINSNKVQTINTQSGRGVGNFNWGQDSETLFFLEDVTSNENYHVAKVSIAKPKAKSINLTPLKGVRAFITKIPRDDPHHIYISHNKRDKTVYDLYRLSLKTNQLQLVAENPGDVYNVLIDDSGKLRARFRKLTDTKKSLETLSADGKQWTKVIDWDFEDSLGILGFTSEPNTVWVISNIGVDKTSLNTMDIRTGKMQHVYSEKDVDLQGVFISHITKKPLYAASMPNYPRLHFFDPSLITEFNRLKSEYSGYIRFVSTDNSERTVIFLASTEKKKEYYLYDRNSGKVTLIGASPLSKHLAKLSTTKAISYKSRDGLTIHGYLTIPKGLEGRRVPMILEVHGGPWARDYYGPNHRIQFLANRGYAVLQVNYRGSTGYGKRFKQAAIREFAGKMHDDLIDGVNWAVARGVADKDKVCIKGGSYGGYATLVGMTFTPEVFACGVDVVGMSNLVTLTENAPVYWKNSMPLWYKYIGNPKNPEDRKDMQSRSPLFKVNAVKNPLMIVQGANDPRVTQLESDQMVKALRASGKEVDYLLFKDEGHGIGKWTNNLIYHRRMEDFLAKHLGGRSAGFDYFQLGTLIFNN